MKMKVLLLAACLTIFAGSAYGQQTTLSVMGNKYLNTLNIATTNTSALMTTVLSTAYGSTIDFTKVKAALITCETNDARISFGVAAENDASPVGHVLAAGTSLRLPSSSMVRSAYIISKTSGSAATLMVTLEY